jgi:hypothetical protein
MKTKRKKEEIKNKKQKTKKNGGNDKVNIVESGTIKITGDFKKYFENYQSMIANSEKLEQHYDKFWNNVYYNDTYLFYKYAIQYYQDICNGKTCNGFTKTINTKLITGKCDFTDERMRQKFINQKNANIDKIYLDDLCEFTVQIINNLDRVFQICPKLPFSIIVYRHETRGINDPLLQIKKGDFYRNNNFMSTTINPWYMNNETNIIEAIQFYQEDSNDLIEVQMEIILPEKTMAYYINYPFGIYELDNIEKYDGLYEFEILLQRNNIFKIIETQKINDVFFITMELIMQYKHNFNSVEKETTLFVLPDIINKKKQQQNLMDNNSYIKYDNYKKENFIANQRYDFYKEMCEKVKKRTPNKYFTEVNNYNIRLHQILRIKTKNLIEWKIKKPSYSKKKYPNFTEKGFNKIYETFVKLTTQYKPQNTNTIYVNSKTPFMSYNFQNLENKLIKTTEINNEIFKIEYPLIITKKMSASIFGDIEYFICDKKGNNAKMYDNYFSIDHSFPITIIIKYVGDVSYHPTQMYDGITFDVQEMQIKKVNKIQLATQTFFYLVEATKPDEVVNVAK